MNKTTRGDFAAEAPHDSTALHEELTQVRDALHVALAAMRRLQQARGASGRVGLPDSRLTALCDDIAQLKHAAHQVASSIAKALPKHRSTSASSASIHTSKAHNGKRRRCDSVSPSAPSDDISSHNRTPSPNPTQDPASSNDASSDTTDKAGSSESSTPAALKVHVEECIVLAFELSELSEAHDKQRHLGKLGIILVGTLTLLNEVEQTSHGRIDDDLLTDLEWCLNTMLDAIDEIEHDESGAVAEVVANVLFVLSDGQRKSPRLQTTFSQVRTRLDSLQQQQYPKPHQQPEQEQKQEQIPTQPPVASKRQRTPWQFQTTRCQVMAKQIDEFPTVIEHLTDLIRILHAIFLQSLQSQLNVTLKTSTIHRSLKIAVNCTVGQPLSSQKMKAHKTYQQLVDQMTTAIARITKLNARVTKSQQVLVEQWNREAQRLKHQVDQIGTETPKLSPEPSLTLDFVTKNVVGMTSKESLESFDRIFSLASALLLPIVHMDSKAAARMEKDKASKVKEALEFIVMSILAQPIPADKFSVCNHLVDMLTVAASKSSLFQQMKESLRILQAHVAKARKEPIVKDDVETKPHLSVTTKPSSERIENQWRMTSKAGRADDRDQSDTNLVPPLKQPPISAVRARYPNLAVALASWVTQNTRYEPPSVRSSDPLQHLPNQQNGVDAAHVQSALCDALLAQELAVVQSALADATGAMQRLQRQKQCGSYDESHDPSASVLAAIQRLQQDLHDAMGKLLDVPMEALMLQQREDTLMQTNGALVDLSLTTPVANTLPEALPLELTAVYSDSTDFPMDPVEPRPHSSSPLVQTANSIESEPFEPGNDVDTQNIQAPILRADVIAKRTAALQEEEKPPKQYP
ncbi:hypothetical protein FI667_g14655, partial [Globisporangium splendens]